MPTRIGSTTTSTSGAAVAVASQTVSVTVPAGTSRCLVVGIVGRNVVSSSNNNHTVTWNGQALTMVGSAILPSGNFDFAQIWYLTVGLSTATANLVVTNSPNNQVITLGAQCWLDVDQSTPFGPFVSDTQTSTSPSLTAVTGPGDEVIDVLGDFLGSAPNTQTPTYTAEWSQLFGGFDEDQGGQSTRTATTTSTQIGWTVAPSGLWWYGAAALKKGPGDRLSGQASQQFAMGLGA